MSYSIALWDPSRHQPVPTTFDEATAMYRKLADVDDGPNYWFVSFAQRIQDHVRLSPNPDEILLGYYGSFVEVAQRHTGALFSVELPTEERIPLLRLMLDTATALNLVVYDDSSGLVFLPGGNVLPEERAYIWEDIKAELNKPGDFPRTKAEFKKMAAPVLAGVFGRYGFRREVESKNVPAMLSGALAREIVNGKQYINIFYEGGCSRYGVDVSVFVSFESVKAIYNQFRFTGSSVLFGVGLRELCGWSQGWNEVASRAEFDAQVPVIERVIMELLETAKDIRGLDQVMNGEGIKALKGYLHKTIYIPHCLIVARLAGNPNFEGLVIELSEAAKKFWHPVQDKDFFEEWARLIAYLREEVKPLV